jgi:hypothetical protein
LKHFRELMLLVRSGQQVDDVHQQHLLQFGFGLPSWYQHTLKLRMFRSAT